MKSNAQKVHWTILDQNFELDVEIHQYAKTRNPAIELYENGAPFAVVSVNVPAVYGSELVAIKNYSENCGVLEALIEAGVVSEPIYFTRSGLVEIPVCELLIEEEEQ